MHRPVAAPAEESWFIDTVALRRQTPAWAVSLLVHVMTLLVLALFVSRPDETPKATEIIARGVEDDPPPTEFDTALPLQALPDTAPAPAAMLHESPAPSVAVSTEFPNPAEPVANEAFADADGLFADVPLGKEIGAVPAATPSPKTGSWAARSGAGRRTLKPRRPSICA